MLKNLYFNFLDWLDRIFNRKLKKKDSCLSCPWLYTLKCPYYDNLTMPAYTEKCEEFRNYQIKIKTQNEEPKGNQGNNL